MSFVTDLFRPNSRGASAQAGQQAGRNAAALSDPFSAHRGEIGNYLASLFANGQTPSYFTPGQGMNMGQNIQGMAGQGLPEGGAGLPTAGAGMADAAMLNPTEADIINDPVRAAQMRTMTNAVNNAAAATGQLDSGSTLAALQENAGNITASAGDRLYGRNLSSFQARNNAQQQDFLQRMGVQGTNFSQLFNTQGARFGQNLAAGGFTNAAQGQMNNQGNQYLNFLAGLAGATPQNAAAAGSNIVQGFNAGTEAQTQQNATAGRTLNMIGNIGSWLATPSDVRLKEDITHVGQTHAGLPIYSYRYKWGGPKTMGVMAQDVEKVDPDAVTTHASGFKLVNYGKVH